MALKEGNNMSLDINNIVLPNKIDHVGVVVKSADKTLEFLSSIWPLGDCPIVEYFWGKNELTAGEPFGAKLIFVNLGPVSLELIEPREGYSPHHRHLREYGEGMNHVAFNITNWDKVVARFMERGSRMILGGVYEGKRWCYFEANPGGIIIEFTDNFGIHNPA
jgi:catechol 2,3-dioxygenase-like lactoylglutathione lyase family enzyme